jgi:hypothetical protein
MGRRPSNPTHGAQNRADWLGDDAEQGVWQTSGFGAGAFGEGSAGHQKGQNQYRSATH